MREITSGMWTCDAGRDFCGVWEKIFVRSTIAKQYRQNNVIIIKMDIGNKR